MEIIAGILGAAILYAVLWFFVLQHHSAKENSRQQGFEAGRREGFNRGIEVHRRLESIFPAYNVEGNSSHANTEQDTPDWLIPMPDEIFSGLGALTVNEGIDKGLITSIGIGDAFVFTVNSSGTEDKYVVVNNFALMITQELAKIITNDIHDESLMDYLVFSNYQQTEDGRLKRFQIRYCYQNTADEPPL